MFNSFRALLEGRIHFRKFVFKPSSDTGEQLQGVMADETKLLTRETCLMKERVQIGIPCRFRRTRNATIGPTSEYYDYTIPAADSNYFAVNNCVVGQTQSLVQVNLQLWPPTMYPDLPSPMNSWNLMNLLYNYNGWNSGGNGWNSIEKFWFSPTYGWVAWEQWNLEDDNGTYTYKKANSAYMGQYEATGNVPPAQPGGS
jgi:hypothetical protein